MSTWNEVFESGVLTITGSGDSLEPLQNHKNDAVVINIEGSFKIIAEKCFSSFKLLTQINFPDSIEELSDNIIEFTDKLESLTLPKSLKKIYAGNSFDWTYSLKNVFVVEENPYFCDIDGVLFSKDKKTLYFVPGGRNEIAFYIPYGVETIFNAAFSHSKILQTIVIPPTVTLIHNYFGFGSEAIKSVVILQCQSKVEFHYENTFQNTQFQNNPQSIIHYMPQCLSALPTCAEHMRSAHSYLVLISIFIMLKTH